MQLAHFLAEKGTPATNLKFEAAIRLIPGTGVTSSALTLVGVVSSDLLGTFGLNV
jgi:osmotically inducible protein OsmC